MSQRNVKEQIMDQLQGSGEPALSAQQLAEKLGVSVPTVNAHTEDLVADDRVETTQIGNATAYYISTQGSGRDHPHHTCKKCGRQTPRYDFAKVEIKTYFDRGGVEDEVGDFEILCRFCYTDFVSWVYNDPGSMGDYPRVHRWNIPDAQLEEVRNDPDIDTAPTTEFLSGAKAEMFDIIEELCEEADEEVVLESDIIESAEDKGFTQFNAQNTIQDLFKTGHLRQQNVGVGKAYSPAK